MEYMFRVKGGCGVTGHGEGSPRRRLGGKERCEEGEEVGYTSVGEMW